MGQRPWDTRSFEAGGVKQVPVREYMMAGLWIGLVISGCLGLILLWLQRWWGCGEAAPVLGPGKPMEEMKLRWFGLALVGILCFALWQRWPAMRLSFWGDEGWMFCDFVHGKWHPAVKNGSLQEYLRFHKTDWMQAVFGDYSGNNHWLATLLQRGALKSWQVLGGHPVWSFQEWVVRLVPLAAGLGSLAALAGWMRWMGRPVAGLVATLFMALHPWHVRFSVEARGYSLMLFFFILTMWSMMKALRDGRKRDWLLFGLAQFFMIYSWKGGMYALIFMNAVLAVRLLWGPMINPSLRKVAVVRWLSAGLFGAMLFIPLVMSSQLQMQKSIVQVRNRAKPMGEAWLKDTATGNLVGIPSVEQDPANPREISLQRIARRASWTWPAVWGVTLVFLCGLWRLWRQDRFLAWVCVGVLVSGVVAAVHFKYGLRVELLSWYLLYNLPVLALLFATALSPSPGHVLTWQPGPMALRRSISWSVGGAALLSGFAALAAPMVKDFQHHPRENLKRAAKITRGAHEARGFKGPSPIYTGWLWRHTFAYEPRGDTYVRTKKALDAKMQLARSKNGEFYMIVGMRDLSGAICADVMRELKNPAKFDHLQTLWGVEFLNTLDVYRMRKDAPVQPDQGE